MVCYFSGKIEVMKFRIHARWKGAHRRRIVYGAVLFTSLMLGAQFSVRIRVRVYSYISVCSKSIVIFWFIFEPEKKLAKTSFLIACKLLSQFSLMGTILYIHIGGYWVTLLIAYYVPTVIQIKSLLSRMIHVYYVAYYFENVLFVLPRCYLSSCFEEFEPPQVSPETIIVSRIDWLKKITAATRNVRVSEGISETYENM